MTTPTKRTRKKDDCIDFSPTTVHLSSGSHGPTYQGECCLVEAACQATIACTSLAKKYGKPSQFGDDHPSISPVIRVFAIGLNDTWNDETRQRLVPYVTKILGTKTTESDEQERAWMATDWLARVHAPAFLRLAGLTEHAQVLESLARIVDATTARAAQPSLDVARTASDAASAAAWAAAWDAARAAARDAARDAAWDAASAAAWAAARDALASVVASLQTSALELLDRMIAVGSVSQDGEE